MSTATRRHGLRTGSQTDNTIETKNQEDLVFEKRAKKLWHQVQFRKQYQIFRKYRNYSMIGQFGYCANIELAMLFAAKIPMKDLVIVECGTWRGGMTFGMLEAVPECR